MQTLGAITHTLLEAQDIYATTNFRGLPTALIRRETERRLRPAPHDFLLLCPRPDLMPGLLAAEPANARDQSCERNMPQK